ncbi:unnamed protein product [Mesocestoides corti]|uniref:Uncharacterized protein n=2 Tax=Mesocestoides corti TaxID=53468 RepID=A0A158QS59_MESCO|nr:unnamed protein product [Mesocestoides corti]
MHRPRQWGKRSQAERYLSWSPFAACQRKKKGKEEDVVGAEVHESQSKRYPATTYDDDDDIRQRVRCPVNGGRRIMVNAIARAVGTYSTMTLLSTAQRSLPPTGRVFADFQSRASPALTDSPLLHLLLFPMCLTSSLERTHSLVNFFIERLMERTVFLPPTRKNSGYDGGGGGGSNGEGA